MVNENPMTDSGISADDRNLAMIGHLLGILTGFIGALVIWIINKDRPEKAFVIDQAKEALNFQITIMIASIISGLLTLILIGFLFIPVIAIANLVLCIIAGLKAKDGIAYRYPFTLRLLS